MATDNFIEQNKKAIRKLALDIRDKQKKKEELSDRIIERVYNLPEFNAAGSILIYLDIKSEVRTRPYLTELLSLGKVIVVPFITKQGLELFHLEDLGELEDGAFGVLEPALELRKDDSKIVLPAEIDIALIPGVAFDKNGSRLGYGKGYYDRLLLELKPECLMIGLAFECQIFPSVPQEEHDISIDKIVTESQIYDC